MLVHTLLSGVRVGGRTTVERVRGLWPQVREMCVLRFRRGMYSYELRVRHCRVRRRSRWRRDAVNLLPQRPATMLRSAEPR